MRIKFWGTRGSLPKPGKSTLKYGGNTSCVELTSKEGLLAVFDCGSGAHNLGLHLLSDRNRSTKGCLFFSHTHWDHIQGMPFFPPLFLPHWEWDIYGPQGLGQSIKESLSGQMLHDYFPITIEDFGANIRFHGLTEEEFVVGDLVVKTRYLNHTNLTIGYRVESRGKAVVYACDHEPYSPYLASGEGEITGEELSHLAFLEGADLVIHDAQYLAEEYSQKIGWGHSTVEYVVRMCREANVKQVALTHHDPTREDGAIDALQERLTGELAAAGRDFKAFFAREGGEIFLGRNGSPFGDAIVKSSSPLRGEEEKSPLTRNHSVLICCAEEGIKNTLKSAVEAEGIACITSEGEGKLLLEIAEKRPSLLLLEHAPPKIDGVKLAEAIALEERSAEREIPIILVASPDMQCNENFGAASDIIPTPFTNSYARSKISAWIFRANHSAREREKEGKGSFFGKRSKVLQPVVRIAAALYGLSIALIEVEEGGELSFSAYLPHGVEEPPKMPAFLDAIEIGSETVVIADAARDERFSGSLPLYGGLPIRFILIHPLKLEGEKRGGLLLLMDQKPKELSSEKLSLLSSIEKIVAL